MNLNKFPELVKDIADTYRGLVGSTDCQDVDALHQMVLEKQLAAGFSELEIRYGIREAFRILNKEKQ